MDFMRLYWFQDLQSFSMLIVKYLLAKIAKNVNKWKAIKQKMKKIDEKIITNLF